jgi:hypothetical protein
MTHLDVRYLKYGLREGLRLYLSTNCVIRTDYRRKKCRGWCETGVLDSSPTPAPQVVCVNNHKALDASVCNYYSIPVKRLAGRTEGNRDRSAGGGSVVLSMGVWRVLKNGTSRRSRSIIWRLVRVIKSKVLRSARHLVRARETRNVGKYLNSKHLGTGHLKDRRRVRQEINAVMHIKNTVSISQYQTVSIR